MGAAGFILTNNGQSLFPLFEHFDGTSWSVASSPSPGLGRDVLTGVTALAPNNVWAVGFYAKDVNTDGPTKTLIEHWDGSSWKIVPSPSPANSNTWVDILFDGTVIPQGNLWLVGNEFGRTLVLNATGR